MFTECNPTKVEALVSALGANLSLSEANPGEAFVAFGAMHKMTFVGLMVQKLNRPDMALEFDKVIARLFTEAAAKIQDELEELVGQKLSPDTILIHQDTDLIQ